MGVIIGSARIDERGKLLGGKAGDQKQGSGQDYKGEVSMQNFYIHKKGWTVIRPKEADHALKIAANMITACNNPHLGYDQNQRLGVIEHGVATKKDTECDCSSLVRACVKEATGKDPGNFTTANAASTLAKTGLFEKATVYKSGMTLYTGDILCTRTKGHIVAVTAGAARNIKDSAAYYPLYSGNTTSIVTALASVGEKDTSFSHRKDIAIRNGVADYKGTALQNTQLLNLLKQGRLKK